MYTLRSIRLEFIVRKLCNPLQQNRPVQVRCNCNASSLVQITRIYDMTLGLAEPLPPPPSSPFTSNICIVYVSMNSKISVFLCFFVCIVISCNKIYSQINAEQEAMCLYSFYQLARHLKSMDRSRPHLQQPN